jgi:hypothetical protein
MYCINISITRFYRQNYSGLYVITHIQIYVHVLNRRGLCLQVHPVKCTVVLICAGKREAGVQWISAQRSPVLNHKEWSHMPLLHPSHSPLSPPKPLTPVPTQAILHSVHCCLIVGWTWLPTCECEGECTTVQCTIQRVQPDRCHHCGSKRNKRYDSTGLLTDNRRFIYRYCTG